MCIETIERTTPPFVRPGACRNDKKNVFVGMSRIYRDLDSSFRVRACLRETMNQKPADVGIVAYSLLKSTRARYKRLRSPRS